ncbi:MAG: sigma-70 family RNA polymerase sigma factor [Gammaproteobacteria bacterium]|nr:sigma-70 family RNA polymerase sigma factor [Gammaproteobacteria bacterium]
MPATRTSDRRSDQALVDVCNNGDAAAATEAFEVLYRRHKPFVLRVARRFLHDPDQALDVLQETFSYLLRKFPPAGTGLTLTAQLTTLLYPVAKNSALSVLRKNDRYSSAEAPDPDELPSGATEGPSDVARLVGCLPPERREIVMMRFVDDMALADIARALDVPLGTVKSRLHLAIKALRDDPEVKKFFAP